MSNRKYAIIKDDKIVTYSASLERAKEYAAMEAKDCKEGTQVHVYSFVTSAINRAVVFSTIQPTNGKPIKKKNKGGKHEPWTKEEEQLLGVFMRAGRLQGKKDTEIAEQIVQSGKLPYRTAKSITVRISKLRNEQ